MKNALAIIMAAALVCPLAYGQDRDDRRPEDQRAQDRDRRDNRDQNNDRDRNNHDRDNDRDRDRNDRDRNGGNRNGLDAKDRAVHITSGPTVRGMSGHSATVVWSTDKTAASDVHYSGNGGREQVAYERGGSRNHSVTLNGLRPNTEYRYRIMTHDNEVRYEGTFHTPGR
jgi:hypothetical protein